MLLTDNVADSAEGQYIVSLLGEIDDRIDGWCLNEHNYLDGGKSVFTLDIGIPKGVDNSVDYMLQILDELCDRSKIDSYGLTEHHLCDSGQSLFDVDIVIPQR